MGKTRVVIKSRPARTHVVTCQVRLTFGVKGEANWLEPQPLEPGIHKYQTASGEHELT